MGLIKWLFGNKEATSTPVAPIIKENRLTYFTNNPSEKTFASARIENGEVYCLALNPFKVGSYEQDGDNTFTVWNDKHTLKIGQINTDNRTIFLMVGDLWCQVKRSRPYAPTPKNFVYEAASWFGNNIQDAGTKQTVAQFTGDSVAAAAAFVCLTYEVLMYNKYYDFFHGWNQ